MPFIQKEVIQTILDSFITVGFPFADEKKIEVTVAVIMQKHPLSSSDAFQTRDNHSQQKLQRRDF